MSLTSASCSSLCDEVGTGLVVDCLVVVPSAELVLPLNLREGAHREINTSEECFIRLGGRVWQVIQVDRA